MKETFESAIEPQRQDNLNQLATERCHPVLTLKGDFFERHSSGLLSIVRSRSDEIQKHDTFSVLIESGGGELEPFFRVLKAIRQHVKTVYAMVPGPAKSAATFFCLGVDKIHMGPDGELGPLDPQILDRSGGIRRISPLETFTALDELRNYSLETAMSTLDVVVAQLLARSHMDLPYAVERATQLVSAIAGALYSRVDTHELGEMGRYLSVSERYAELVMKRWSYPELTEEHRTVIIHKLVREYPTHGFVIDMDEAIDIGLKAELLETRLTALCQEVLKNTSGTEFIGLGFPIESPNQSNDISALQE